MGKDLHFVGNSAKITMEKNTRMSRSRFRQRLPAIQPRPVRSLRRFAPRNDTSGERAVHQCTCAVELPSARCSGNAAAFPIGAISRFLRKKIPEAQASGIFSLSKKSLWAFSPSCFQNCKINFCSMILQFCRCGGLWNAKGNPDGFLSHFSSLRNLRLSRFFDRLILYTYSPRFRKSMSSSLRLFW